MRTGFWCAGICALLFNVAAGAAAPTADAIIGHPGRR